MRTMSIRRTFVTLAAAAALLAGCGGNGGEGARWEQSAPADNGVAALAPNEVLEKAKTALRDAKSFRLKGSGKTDGEQMSVDLRASGNDLGGTVTMGGANVEMLAVAGQQYMRGDEKFWTLIAGANAGDDMAKLMGDKWLKVPNDDQDFAEMFGMANVDELLKPDGTLAKGESKEINGVPTIGLVDGGAEGGTVYVATTGEPYPIQMVSTGSEAGELTFSDFGATFDDLKAPAETEVVDLSELNKGN